MSNLSFKEQLARAIQAQANDPAYFFNRTLIASTALECGGIPLWGRGPCQSIEPLDDPGFFAGCSHASGAATESNHLHSRQGECYVGLAGIPKITCRRGNQTKDYILAPHDIVLVPRGVWHHVSWIEPGLAYVFRAPATGGIEKLIYDPTRPFGL